MFSDSFNLQFSQKKEAYSTCQTPLRLVLPSLERLIHREPKDTLDLFFAPFLWNSCKMIISRQSRFPSPFKLYTWHIKFSIVHKKLRSVLQELILKKNHTFQLLGNIFFWQGCTEWNIKAKRVHFWSKSREGNQCPSPHLRVKGWKMYFTIPKMKKRGNGRNVLKVYQPTVGIMCLVPFMLHSELCTDVTLKMY